ncbi:MAG: phosphatidylglycerol lysyltransferase domain-containing protein [Clostridia bacterium]|nr:phosphatidylglycerol lysyltransferase domain-containing protein [Clostridia bacterium]
MLPFQPVKLEDKEKADECLSKQNYRICEHCFADLFIWKDHYDTQLCFFGGFLIIKMATFPEKVPMYLAPIGKGDLKEVLLAMEDDARERGIDFTLCSIPEPMVTEIEAAMPRHYSISDFPDGADYIYSAEKLITLSGKKLQSKRNFVNRFKKTYEGRWSYEEMTDENKQEAYAFHLHWCETGDNCPNGTMYSGETCAVSLALDNRKALGMKGGILRLDGKVIAFTMGCPVSEDTYVVQLEKAEASIAGAYPMINQQFAQHNFEGYTYVNREDDLGLEGLRKAKLSYHPAMMGKKFMAVKA